MNSHPRGLDRRDLLPRDHPGVGDKAHPPHAEPGLEALGHQVERGDVGRVARPHVARHRNAVPVDHHAEDHLPAVVAAVLALAEPARRLAAEAGEVQRGGVEEHQVEVGEQVPAAGEQRLIDEVLGPPRRGAAGLRGVERLAEPAHRAVHVMQVQPVDALDGLVASPAHRAAVRSGDRQPVEHGHERRPLDVEPVPAADEQRPDRVPAPGLPPQPLEDQGRADGGDPGVRLRAGALGKDHQALGEAGAGTQEPVDGAAGGEPVEPAERGDDRLPDPFALAAVLDDLEALVRAGPLDTDEHGGAPFGHHTS
ncbi:MAG: hypothetical protein OXH79_09140 [Boseongicola sp.]|nr:hypothetical protein [Boseongicola sp.]